MARIVVTSDLHYDDEVDLTPPETVAAHAEKLASLDPDVVLLAGDLGHPLRNFEGCLNCFTNFPVPVGVVPGNHDIWRDPDGEPGSWELWRSLLPEAVRKLGMAWLEKDAIVIGSTAIIGTLAWYDYSAVDPALALSADQLADLKQHATNDSVWVNLPWPDPVFANRLGAALEARLDALEWEPSIKDVVIVTHVPLFEQQMARRTDEASWGLLRAYFGNFTTGARISRFPKVHTLVSGHIHRPVDGPLVDRPGLDPLPVHVVGSDYGTPGLVIIEVGDGSRDARIITDGPPLS